MTIKRDVMTALKCVLKSVNREERELERGIV